jgi:hypothetical protein
MLKAFTWPSSSEATLLAVPDVLNVNEPVAPDISTEFNRVAPSNHRKGVEILCDGGRKLTVRSRSWADLLIPSDCKNRQHGCE